jgi:hypothetical protein
MLKFIYRVRTMNKVYKNISSIIKITLIFVFIFSLQKVNIINEKDKVSNENINKTLDLTAMAMKYNEMQLADINYPLDTYTGDLTGYVANCPLCSGYLGCTGAYVGNGTTSYNDSTYGNVYILASSKNLSCGSIVRMNVSSISSDPIYGIVLDRGVTGTSLDMLVSSNDIATTTIGRKRITYDVLRYGWTRNAN